MKSKIRIGFLLFSFFIVLVKDAVCQDQLISGRVSRIDESGSKLPLAGATILWLKTNNGVFSNDQGQFSIKQSEASNQLVISLIGYQPDTITVSETIFVEAVLQPLASVMDEVDIIKRKKSTETSFVSPIQVERINEKELQKAACCSLSESFETSPTVDVSFTDAVTGTRQIEMLGLSGPNIQITREGIPTIRGLNALYGLELVPGTWIESIHLNKGTGSVVNGFESIAGQMNVELRKPMNSDKLYVNGYVNEGGRLELNTHLSHKVSDNWSTGILLHGKSLQQKSDRNKDGFLDNVLGEHLFALNRWKYVGDDGLRFQVGGKVSFMDNVGGQVIFQPTSNVNDTPSWGMTNKLSRYEGWAKMGKLYEDIPWKSFGLHVAASSHNQESIFGRKLYRGKQNSFYFNGIYQSILSNTNHKFKTGVSLYYDDYIESLDTMHFDRLEAIPGTFFEYTYNKDEKFNAVLGIRGDYHNTYGAFATPRMHLRYALASKRVLRAFVGRGQRTASIIAENFGVLSSSRQIMIEGDDSNKPYGLDPEKAWNSGLSYTHGFDLGIREGTLKLDAYRTEYINQIVVDRESPQEIRFYNLDGSSYSNSVSAQIDYELAKRFDVRIAYRYYDVKTTFDGELKRKPFISSNRAFINFAYQTGTNWKFDATLNWQDKKRIPSTAANPDAYRRDELSPSFIMLNGQISKNWNDKFEAYIGVENLLDFRQDDPIIASDDPFGQHFDGSLIWGPIFGRNSYLGFRYRIK